MHSVLKCKTCKSKPPLCSTCRSRLCREADPVRYSYNNLKSNADRRGKVFTISLEYFRQFCYRTDYIAGKGRSRESYTVDRIIEELGYIEGNLQVLTNEKNVKKYLNYDWEHKVATVQTVKIDKENLPF